MRPDVSANRREKVDEVRRIWNCSRRQHQTVTFHRLVLMQSESKIIQFRHASGKIRTCESRGIALRSRSEGPVGCLQKPPYFAKTLILDGTKLRARMFNDRRKWGWLCPGPRVICARFHL